MKLRIAKKILMGNGSNWRRHFFKLRPPYTDKDGCRVHPSWHDIEIVGRARKTLLRYHKRGAKPEFLIEKFIKRMKFKYRCKIDYEICENNIYSLTVRGKFDKSKYIVDEEIFSEEFHERFKDTYIIFK